ncbi:MAG: outer membrane beta-barrel protein, partial [Bacteroidota bacterium]
VTQGLQGYYINSSHSVSLPQNYSLEGTLAYNGPNVSIWRSEPYFSLAVGARKRFKNNSSLTFRISDALNTIVYQNSYIYENVEFTNQYKPETFRISLAYSYAFGNQKIQLRKKESGLQEEIDRINRQN